MLTSARWKNQHGFSPIVLIVFILLLLTGLAYWYIKLNSLPKYTGPVEKITVSNTEEYSTLVWIAENQGYFRNNGLEVITKDYPSGKLAADEMLAGRADISVSAEVVFTGNSFTNPDLRILGTVDSVDTVKLIARKDRGIAKPGDLKGRKIGVTKKSVSEFFLGTFLTFNNLSLADVEIIDLSPKDMAGALLRGDVDAVMTWPPTVNDINRQLGDKAISWSGQNGRRYYMLLLAKEKFIHDKPEIIERLLKSMVQAEEFVQNHNETAKNFIAEKYHYDSAYMNVVWPTHNFVVSLDQSLLLLMEDEARWRIANKLTDKTLVPNYTDFIYKDALRKVKLDAVTLY